MGKLCSLAAVFCALSSGCNHLEPAAEAADSSAVATGQILGMISDPGSVRDAVVRLGAVGPVTAVAPDGTFTFRDLQPGCYDLHLVEAGRETLEIEATAACVTAGRSSLLSIIFGSI